MLRYKKNDKSSESLKVTDEKAEEVEEEIDFDEFLNDLNEELKPVEEQLPPEFTEEQTSAIIKMQAMQRGAKDRNELRKRKESATKVQAFHRGHKKRKELEEKRKAAVKLQAMHRGYVDRKELNKQKNSAIKMQAVHRGYMDRKKIEKNRKQVHDDEINASPSPPKEKRGKNTVKWPKREIAGWEKMIGTTYGVQWPKWNSGIPITSCRRRKIKKYQGQMATLDLEKRWDNGTKVSQYREPDMIKKKIMQKSNIKKNKNRKKKIQYF